MQAVALKAVAAKSSVFARAECARAATNTWKALLHDKSLADFTFLPNTPGAASIPAHRAVLAAASPHFAQLFLVEGGGGPRLLRTDRSPAAIEIVLELVYTGDCADQAALRTHAEELILAGGEWGLDAVRSLGVKHCIAKLGLPTFKQLLVLAETQDVPELREHVHAFARANGGAVLASADLVPLQREYPALFNELSSRLNAYLKPGINIEPISLSKLSVVR